MPGPSITGREVPRRRWSKPPVARSSIQDHSSASTMERRPSSRTLPPLESMTSSRTFPRSRQKLQRATVESRWDLVGGVPEEGPGVVGGPYLGVEVVVFQFLGGEVAEVLVDQVRDVAAGDLVVPVGLVAYLLHPGGRDVPVVADLVVVEDHGRGDGREEPADRGVPPGVPVQAGVLHEVRDGLARGTRPCRAGSGRTRGCRRGVCGRRSGPPTGRGRPAVPPAVRP